MGNSQPSVQPPLVSRPYDAACKNIAQTSPTTIVTSYQRPKEAQDASQETRASDDSNFSGTRSNGRGWCFSPSKKSSSGPISLRRESFWDYGECLGDESTIADENTGNENDIQAEREGFQGGHGMGRAVTDESDEKLSTTDTTANGALHKDQMTPRKIADLMKSIEARSQVRMPVYGAVSNHKPFLEPQILDHLLPFILDSTLSKCFAVCPHWLRAIYSHLRHKCQPILESFQRTYCQDGHLQYESSTLNVQPIFTAEVAAVRIDLLIYCKVLPACQNHCTQMGYSFSYATTPSSPVIPPTSSASNTPKHSQRKHRHRHFNDEDTDTSDDDHNENECQGGPVFDDPLASTRLAPESTLPPTPTSGTIIPPTSSSYNAKPAQREYQAQFRFETIRKGSRRHIWIQRDMCRFHGDELMVASMSNVPTVCVDDCIEVPVNIANAFGLVDLNTIAWMPLEFIYDPYRQFGQHCELERPKQLWVGLDQFQPTTNERLQNNDHFGAQWRHLKTEFTGIDVILSRSQYVAAEIGEVPNTKRWLGLEACVRPANLPIVCALPRLGLQHDRFSMKHFRQGDSIWLYVSQGGGVLQ